MHIYDVVLASAKEFLNPLEGDWRTDQVNLEDQLVIDAFEKLGLKAIREDWASTSFDWSTTKSVLIRATWDYHERFEEFENWVLRTNDSTQLFNSGEAVAWNMDKIYLREMQSQGINIPQTVFFDKNESKDVVRLASSLNWAKFIVKPCISAGGRETHLFTISEIQEKSEFIHSLFAQEDMMIQEFQHNIVSQGEVSIIMFGDQYSHAVIKNAKPGDFRVQDDFGGSVRNYVPSNEEIEFAKACIAACPFETAYARVDYFKDNRGQLALGELEIIEPELWFRQCETAADLLARTIKNRLQG